MPPVPDLRTLLNRFRTSAGTAGRRRARGRQRWAGGFGVPWRQRRGNLGTALVQALMVGLVAVIGALLLATRLFSSRFNSFSRGDTLAARDAAELGLNELQAQLNTDQYGYLWVTRRNSWGTVSRSALSSCQVSVLDSSGNEVTALPALPAGINSARTIRTDSEATISYQLSGFEPPSLPDDSSSTQNQVDICGENNSASAANFGNLKGGSALITVTGTVTRGNTQTEFRLSRRPHVVLPGSQLAFSFIILGDAYNDTANKDSFGASSDISKLNYFDGNICYGQITDTTCFTTPPLPKTVIGCHDLGSCLINNIDAVDSKLRSKYCADVKAKKKKRKGFTCNDFQQIGTLPPAPTPLTTGFLNDSGAAYTNADFVGTDGKGKGSKAVDILCTLKDNKCNGTAVFFPYKTKSVPSKLNGLKNSDLVDGCYFNNVSSESKTVYSNSKTNAINCLFSKLTIKDQDKNNPNLMIYTTTGTKASDPKLLPVNIYLYGATKDTISLADGGIDNSDRSEIGWSRLQILGRQVSTSAGSSVSCSQSPGIISTKGNDLNNLFLWLPNASLTYNRKASNDNSYVVIWACEFTGPTKNGSNKYSIITPIPERIVRAGLVNTLGSSFVQSGGITYRGFGSEDTPTP